MKFFLLLLGVFIGYCNGEVRIAGGTPTTVNEYPFAAALLFNEGGTTFVQRCGGTILTSTAVLTAASCFHITDQVQEPRIWRVRVGSSHSDSGGTIHFVRIVEVHTLFQMSTRANDVGMLRTTLNIVMQPGVVERAFIPGPLHSFSPNQVVMAIGWGDGSEADAPTTQLRHVPLWVVGEQLCAERYADTPFVVNHNVVCAGWIDVGVRGQCPGDEGSPLVDSNKVVVGIFSYAEGCAHLMYPGLNTRVAGYLDWIISTAVATN